MRKMLTLVAAVALAASANAATYGWGPANGITAYNGTDQYDGTVYLMDATATSQAAFFTAVLAAADIGSAFTAAVGSAINSATYDGTEWSFSSPAKGTWDDTNWAVMDNTATAGAFNYYQVAFDAGNNAVLISDAMSGTIPSVGAAMIEFADSGVNKFADAASFAGGGWYTASVPEPTSGLLLLLGVAGLALKRKRA